MRGERELERGDVPAGPPVPQETGTEGVSAEAPERVAGLAAGDAVNGDVRPALEAAHGRGRRGPSDAVDCSRIEPAGMEGHLQRGEVRAPGLGRRHGDEEEDECGSSRAERTNPGHGSAIGEWRVTL